MDISNWFIVHFRKVETVPISESRTEKVEQDSPEGIILSDRNIKVVSQLPINNRKKDIKVIAYNDNSLTISYLNHEGERCTSSSDIPYNIDLETTKAIYKNGILEVTFDR